MEKWKDAKHNAKLLQSLDQDANSSCQFRGDRGLCPCRLVVHGVAVKFVAPYDTLWVPLTGGQEKMGGPTKSTI